LGGPSPAADSGTAETSYDVFRHAASLCFILHDAPNDLRAESVSPNPASLIDRTKERAGCNSGGRHPDINSSFHPLRNRDGSYVPALADEI